MAVKEMTYVEALTNLVAFAKGEIATISTEAIAKGEKAIEREAKRTTRGVSEKVQTERAELKNVILDVMSGGKPMKVGDIVKDSRLLDLDVSASLCTARLRELVAEGKVINTKDKKVSTYTIAS